MNEQDKNESGEINTQKSDYLSNIIKSITSSKTNENVTDKENGPHQSTGGAAQPPFDMISALLSNPELLAKIPSLLSGIKPIMDMFAAKTNFEKPKSENEAALVSAHAESSNKNTYDRRAALLCAMKPYLSKERRDAIDYIIKLSRLGDILKTL